MENPTEANPISTEQLILLLKIQNAENITLEEPEDFLAYYTEEENVYDELEELNLIQRSPMNPDEWITTNKGEILVNEMKLIISDRYGKEK